MNSKDSRLPLLFAVVMLLCVLFVAWFVPALNERRFMLQDTQKSIETSLGRERKQQYEYDETVAALPQIQSELDRLIPLNEELDMEVKVLKEERKKLRQEKKDLENPNGGSGREEASGDE